MIGTGERSVLAPRRRPASGYDAIAAGFEQQRALPAGAAKAIRRAILDSIYAGPCPRLLDLGAGSGRIGHAFAAAGDDYFGIDRSSEMLSAFRRRAECGPGACLAQADGSALPFPDAVFDAVLLVQVFSAAASWRAIVDEARRVLRTPGALIVGRTVAPADGLDARMRERLAVIVSALGGPFYRTSSGDKAREYLSAGACSAEAVVAAQWQSDRTAHGFLERHRTGVRFASLPEPIRNEALRQLSDWAQATFGSLDAVSVESHAFRLQIFLFQKQARH